MRVPILLDTFCGEGGAAMGYHRAGYRVVGVDSSPAVGARYPFEFHQGDALDFIAAHGSDFDVIHVSSPCHDWSSLGARTGLDGTGWLLGAARAAVRLIGVPYVIENVPGAPLVNPLVLCGSMFNLGATCAGSEWRQLRRHRLFECSAFMMAPGNCRHKGHPVGVYGTGGGGPMTRGYKATPREAAEALGIDWMSRAGLSQAIPPAFTEYVGSQLLEFLAV